MIWNFCLNFYWNDFKNICFFVHFCFVDRLTRPKWWFLLLLLRSAGDKIYWTFANWRKKNHSRLSNTINRISGNDEFFRYLISDMKWRWSLPMHSMINTLKSIYLHFYHSFAHNITYIKWFLGYHIWWFILCNTLDIYWHINYSVKPV